MRFREIDERSVAEVLGLAPFCCGSPAPPFAGVAGWRVRGFGLYAGSDSYAAARSRGVPCCGRRGRRERIM
jgi:hypothetical protein